MGSDIWAYFLCSLPFSIQPNDMIPLPLTGLEEWMKENAIINPWIEEPALPASCYTILADFVKVSLLSFPTSKFDCSTTT